MTANYCSTRPSNFLEKSPKKNIDWLAILILIMIFGLIYRIHDGLSKRQMYKKESVQTQ